MSVIEEGTRAPVGSDIFNTVLDFLYVEARLLDDNRFEDWLELLTDDIEYQMPVRQTVAMADGLGFSSESMYYDEDAESMRLRVGRTKSASNWAEEPPSRIHRIVSNVVVELLGQERHVTSSLLLIRSRWDLRTPEVMTARRNDVLRQADDGLRLARREILIDQTNVNTTNLAIFF